MNTHDIELPPLPDPIFISDHQGDGEYFEAEDMQDYARAAVEADRKLHDRMLAHEWIRPVLGLSEDAPYRFDFYAQEIEKLKSDRKRRGEPCFGIYRHRPDENDGREYFHAALSHDETSLSAGERVVKGTFVPDAPQPAEPMKDEQGYCNLDLSCEGGSSCDACRPDETVVTNNSRACAI